MQVRIGEGIDPSQHGRRLTRPTAKDMQRNKEGVLLCVWKADHHNKKTMWAEVRELLGPKLSRHLIKVDKVNEAGGTIRFEIYVREGAGDKILRVLSYKMAHYHISFNRSYKIRQQQRMTLKSGNTPQTPTIWSHQKTFKLISLNINTASGGKLELVKNELFRANADVLALQEHMRSEDDFQPRLSGFTTLSSPAAKAQVRGEGLRGVALLVRNHISCRCKAVQEYFVLASVVLNGASALVGSVYLPQNKKSRKSALKALKKAVIREASESDHVILMGDMNNNRAEIQKLVVDIDFQVSLLE